MNWKCLQVQHSMGEIMCCLLYWFLREAMFQMCWHIYFKKQIEETGKRTQVIHRNAEFVQWKENNDNFQDQLSPVIFFQTMFRFERTWLMASYFNLFVIYMSCVIHIKYDKKSIRCGLELSKVFLGEKKVVAWGQACSQYSGDRVLASFLYARSNMCANTEGETNTEAV